MASKSRSYIFPALLISASVVLVFAVLVSASSVADEQLLKVPLFEAGSLWYSDIGLKLRNFSYQSLPVPNLYSIWTYAIAAISLVLGYYLYQLLIVPMNRVRMLGDVGYIPDGKQSMKDVANQVRKRRMAGDVPPVYPNGWFAVLESRDVKKGESKSVSCLGLHLAVFRAEDGQAHILDAYCPHMGANIAVGGVVKGNCLECPFHGWKFRGDDGKCTEIPYMNKEDKIPDKANIKSYVTLEINGFIHIWHHAEGAEPTWTPPEIEEITKGQWTYRGRTEHIVNAHIEEVPENGADVAHLSQVHGPIMTAGTDLRFTYNKLWSFAQHLWDGGWSPEPAPESHIGVMKLHHSISIFGIPMKLLDMEVEARQIGPGIVYLRYNSLCLGKGAFLHLLTPVAPLEQRMIHQVYIPRSLPTFIANILLFSEALMVERDIMIWNNKRYEKAPVFVKSKEDSLVAKHRRWYSQFYSEHSPRLKFTKDSLDW